MFRLSSIDKYEVLDDYYLYHGYHVVRGCPVASFVSCIQVSIMQTLHANNLATVTSRLLTSILLQLTHIVGSCQGYIKYEVYF